MEIKCDEDKLKFVDGFHIEIHSTIEDKVDKYVEIKSKLTKNGFYNLSRRKEWEHMLPDELLAWKKQKWARIFIITAKK